MSVSSDRPEAESRGKLLPFPRASLRPPGAWKSPGTYAIAAALIGLCVIALIGVAWWTFGGNRGVRYVTAAVTRGPIIQVVSATGTVNPELTIIVGTYVSGVIQSLSCDYNTEVKAGQICAKIDPRPFQAALHQYLAQLARDQAILGKDRTDLVRYQTLSAENSIARQQVEDQAGVVAQDEATVKLDQALVENAQLNLGYTDIVSPVDGTVVSRNVTQGQTVAASFQTPTLFLIASDLKKMQVDTNVSESDIGGIRDDNPSTFTVDAFPKRVFAARVSQIRQSPQTVQNVVTYDAVLAVDNSDLALKPGMTASASIIVDQRSDVLRVPDQALRYAPRRVPASQVSNGEAAAPQAAPGGALIWLLRDGKPVAVPVVLGLDDDTFTEIVSGAVQAGDLVITGEQSASSGRTTAPSLRL